MIECIILAGGLGTRLRSSVPDKPKPLAPIQGVPFLDILLNRLNFVSKVVLAISYKASQIIDHYQKNPPSFRIEYSIEETLLGTGGAIAYAMQKTTSSPILVLNGDSFLDFSFESLLQSHLENQADLTIVSTHVENASRYGQLNIDFPSQKIQGFQEKSEDIHPGWINAGVYLMERTLFNGLDLGPTFSFEKDALPLLLNKKVFSHPCSGTFIDIGTPESFEAAQHILKV